MQIYYPLNYFIFFQKYNPQVLSYAINLFPECLLFLDTQGCGRARTMWRKPSWWGYSWNNLVSGSEHPSDIRVITPYLA